MFKNLMEPTLHKANFVSDATSGDHFFRFGVHTQRRLKTCVKCVIIWSFILFCWMTIYTPKSSGLFTSSYAIDIENSDKGDVSSSSALLVDMQKDDTAAAGPSGLPEESPVIALNLRERQQRKNDDQKQVSSKSESEVIVPPALPDGESFDADI